MEELEDLIKKCQKKEHKAFDKLYEQFSPLVFGICLRYAKNEDDAKDLMQESFLKILERINEYKFQGSFEGWIRRIAVHNAINFLNFNKRFFSSEVELEQSTASYNTTGLENMGEEQLLNIINRLPKGCRAVFNLNVIEGYDHGEIAEMLDITESTSRSQLKIARNRIMDYFKKINYERD